jgi:hypothetical protein
MVGDVALVWRDDPPRVGFAPWTVAPATHDVIAMVARLYFAPIEDEL